MGELERIMRPVMIGTCWCPRGVGDAIYDVHSHLCDEVRGSIEDDKKQSVKVAPEAE